MTGQNRERTISENNSQASMEAITQEEGKIKAIIFEIHQG
jgi:hypothetical protein